MSHLSTEGGAVRTGTTPPLLTIVVITSYTLLHMSRTMPETTRTQQISTYHWRTKEMAMEHMEEMFGATPYPWPDRRRRLSVLDYTWH
jgi:hypothetical protein